MITGWDKVESDITIQNFVPLEITTSQSELIKEFSVSKHYDVSVCHVGFATLFFQPLGI